MEEITDEDWQRLMQTNLVGPFGCAQGLVASICTTSLHSAMQFSESVNMGIVKVNAATSGLEVHVPFGGFKGSSGGGHKELGMESLDFFSRLKTAYVSY